MAADPDADRRQDLRRWREQFTDTVPIADLRLRHPGVCVGVVHKIRLIPDKALEVTIDDGTGRLTAVWAGRTQLPGLELGSALLLEGTVAGSADGALSMRNPAWSPIVEPYG